MLHEGDQAPEFTLQGVQGEVSLASLLASGGTGAGRYVVVYFYPKDKTPGCTREGQAFSAASAAFKKAGAVVVGVSKDTVTMHSSFAAASGITVPLLSDPDLTAHQAYGAYGEKTMYGKKVQGTIRSTFVIGPDGKVVRIFANVKVDGHADKVLEAVVEHKAGGSAPPKQTAAAASKAAPKKSAPAAKKVAAKKSR